jgi:hypothetical protein
LVGDKARLTRAAGCKVHCTPVSANVVVCLPLCSCLANEAAGGREEWSAFPGSKVGRVRDPPLGDWGEQRALGVCYSSYRHFRSVLIKIYDKKQR